MQEIAPNVYLETAFYGGAVAALITDEGIVCIDTPPLPGEARRWRSQLAHLSSKPISLIINTSHNPIRLIGNRWYNAPVMAHELTHRIIATHPEMFRAPHVLHETHESLPELAGVRPILPEISFTDGATVYRGGQRITTLARPGAAASACWVHLPDLKLLFTGDTLFPNPHPLLYTADLDRWLDEIRDLTTGQHPDTTVISGQLPLDADLKTATEPQIEYLRYLRDQLRRLARAGKSDEEILTFIPNILKKYPVEAPWSNFILQRLTVGLPSVFRNVKVAIGIAPPGPLDADAEAPPTEETP